MTPAMRLPSTESDTAAEPLKVPRRVTVLSVGAWGVVLAAHLARAGHAVTAYDLPVVVGALAACRTHPKLPGFELPTSVALTSDLEAALVAARPEFVVVTTPGHALRAMAGQCAALERAGKAAPAPWVICTKAIEEETLLTMTQVAEQARAGSGVNEDHPSSGAHEVRAGGGVNEDHPSSGAHEVRAGGGVSEDHLLSGAHQVRGGGAGAGFVVLSGPSFAAEVALGKPTTVCAASSQPGLARAVQDLFMTDRFRVYTQDDVLGVELGGALKNVVAIAAGVCDGMDLGDNARAALITRGLAEMVRLGVAMGARPETFAGLTGMGDLVLTCGGRLSRNHQFGELLARGRSAKEALAEIGMVVEGMPTVRSVVALAQRHGVEMPIAREVLALIYEGKSAAAGVAALMGRMARPERD
jgi:glycerol-3-phosphate dehydrogenase